MSHEEETSILKRFLVPCLITFGVVLNIGLVSLILCRKSLRITTNFGLISLSLSDTIYGILSYMGLGAFNGFSWADTFFKCSIVYQAIVGAIIISFLSLFFMTIEKFIGVIFPFKHSSMITTKSTLTTLTIFWLYSVLLTIIPYSWSSMGYEEFSVNFTSKDCNFFTYQSDKQAAIWIFHILIIMLLCILLHIPILKEVLKQRKQIASQTNSNRKHLRNVYSLIILLIYNIFSWSLLISQSFVLVNKTVNERRQETEKDDLFFYGGFIVLLTPIFDSFIHGFGRKSFRVEIKNIIKTLFKT